MKIKTSPFKKKITTTLFLQTFPAIWCLFLWLSDFLTCPLQVNVQYISVLNVIVMGTSCTCICTACTCMNFLD